MPSVFRSSPCLQRSAWQDWEPGKTLAGEQQCAYDIEFTAPCHPLEWSLSGPPHQAFSSAEKTSGDGRWKRREWTAGSVGERGQCHSHTPPPDGLPSPPVSEKGRPTKGVAGNPSPGKEGHEAGAGGRRMAGACGAWSREGDPCADVSCSSAASRT